MSVKTVNAIKGLPKINIGQFQWYVGLLKGYVSLFLGSVDLLNGYIMLWRRPVYVSKAYTAHTLVKVWPPIRC